MLIRGREAIGFLSFSHCFAGGARRKNEIAEPSLHANPTAELHASPACRFDRQPDHLFNVARRQFALVSPQFLVETPDDALGKRPPGLRAVPAAESSGLPKRMQQIAEDTSRPMRFFPL